MVDQNYAETIGSITRARPGDRLAPDRVSDFGPADVEELSNVDPERRIQILGMTAPGGSATDNSGLAAAGLAVGLVLLVLGVMQ